MVEVTGTLNLLGFLACVSGTLKSLKDTLEGAAWKARRGVLSRSCYVSVLTAKTFSNGVCTDSMYNFWRDTRKDLRK